jgi:hypothetical protein
MGSVTLAPRDSPEDTRTTEIGEDGAFRFFYVPEGDYELRTEDAASGVSHEQGDGRGNGAQAGPYHRYSKAQAGIHVGDDINSVTLSVADQTAQPAQ